MRWICGFPASTRCERSERLKDILDNIEAIGKFTAWMELAEFAADPKTVYAVTRALEIISEVSRRLPDELKDRHSDIDWFAVAAAGNVYRHEYETVDEAIIWRTVKHDLTALREFAEEELRRLIPGQTYSPPRT